MMPPKKRRFLLLLALGLTALASYLSLPSRRESPSVPTSAEGVVPASSPSQMTAGDGERLPLAQLEKRRQVDEPANTADLFGQKSWYVPPPPPPPEPPPKPTAPPLPYQYMGRLESADGKGKAVIYLMRGNDTVAVSVGDKFDNVYLLEKIEAGYLLIEYLPLGIKQRLPIGVFE